MLSYLREADHRVKRHQEGRNGELDQPGANVIKLFCPRFTDFHTKLECLLY